MSFEDRTYRIVDITGQSGAALQSRFDAVKAAGVIETSLSTARKSLDGTKMMLKYVDSSIGASINAQWPPPKVIFSGTLTEIWTYLIDNAEEWDHGGPA